MQVVREVDFGARHLGQAAARFGGGNLMVDLLVLREPVVNLPRRAALAVQDLPDGAPSPKSGLARLRDFSVTTELKVSAILDAAHTQYPRAPLPRAFVGVFNDRQKPRFNFEHLQRRLDAVSIRPDVQLLAFDISTRR